MAQKVLVLGLMSGTSLDGIDVALIETDGESHVSPVGGGFFPYDRQFREQLRQALGQKTSRENPQIAWLEQELTKAHARAVLAFLAEREQGAPQPELIGFHGHTLWHNPKDKETFQIGDGALLAQMTGIDVVHDFRSADVQAGGQGAPLVPLYHRALVAELPKPLAILNIGGVANLTWIAGDKDDEILAFDTGPGNALLDDWMLEKTGKAYDKDGSFAASGKVDPSHMQLFSFHPYFTRKPPKSLDRDAFMNFVPTALSDVDGAATLTMMSAYSIAEGLRSLPQTPKAVYLTGGGRHNKTLVSWIAEKSELPIHSVDELGWNGDTLEAEAFAYLAVRSIKGLPLSVPTTTGVPKPMTGGVSVKARTSNKTDR
ncbi:MAG: anhydro-N-acetylmuramic acid kinase [Bdellovibrionales bacterium]